MRKYGLTSIAIGLSLVLFVLAFLQIKRSSAAASTILISAVYYDAYLPNQPEESFRLANIPTAPISLTSWTVTDAESTITLTRVIRPGNQWWTAKTASNFTLEFGYPPTSN